MTDRIEESEQGFRALANAMPQMVWTANPGGDADYYNQKWLDYTGLSLDQSLESGWVLALHAEDRQRCLEAWAAACKTAGIYEAECRYRRASDACYRWHLSRALPVKNNDGAIVKWFGTSTDIDDHKQTQAALEKAYEEIEGRVSARTAELTHANQQLEAEVAARSASEHRNRMILEGSHDAFVGMDERAAITAWNAQAAATFGWSRDEAIGSDLAATIIPARFRDDHTKGLARMISTGEGPVIGKRIELPALHRSGTEFPVELTISAVKLTDKYEFFAFLHDVSEREQARRTVAEQSESLAETQEALMQSQKLEAVGKLTGGVAHDFNNVLQVIGGSLQLLQNEIAGNSQAERRIVNALTAVTRGAKLSSQLLAFARKQPLQPVVINLSRLVQGMHDLLQRALGETVEIEAVVSGGLWNTCVDPNQIEHVILNLALNARDAMQGDGKLTIEIGNALLDDDYVSSQPGVTAGQYVVLAISDTGSGMSADVKERAFELFLRPNRKAKGPASD